MPVLVLLFVFTIVYLVQAFSLPYGDMKNVGPGFYPVILSLLMLVALGAQFFRERKSSEGPQTAVNKFHLVSIALFGGLILMLERFGYFASSVVFILSFSMLLGWQLIESYKDETGKKVLIGLPLLAAVSITALDYALFKLAFDFNLP